LIYDGQTSSEVMIFICLRIVIKQKSALFQTAAQSYLCCIF